jgi:hypothetical protein
MVLRINNNYGPEHYYPSRYYNKSLMWFLGDTEFIFFGFRVLTAVVAKNSIFFDVIPCCVVKVNRHIGGMYRLLHQGCRGSCAKNHHEAG